MGVKRNLDSAGMSAPTNNITEDEAALYDRQIRLWGLECQRRIREAQILLIGINGLGAEVVKNLALSGVKSIMIMDNTKVSATDASAQFFVAGSELGKNRAEASKAAVEELNPNVQVLTDNEDPVTKPESFFASFNVVCVAEGPLNVIFKVNQICRKMNIPFFCGATFGLYGYCFLDDMDHPFVRKSQNEDGTTITDVQEHKYCPMENLLDMKVGCGLKKKVNPVFLLYRIFAKYYQLHSKYPSVVSRDSDIEELKKIRSEVASNIGCDESRVTDEMIGSSFGELSPVCAAVGGIYANEIIKDLSERKAMYNIFLFNGDNCIGTVEALIPST